MNRSEKVRFISLGIGTFIGLTGIEWYEHDLTHATSTEALGKHALISILIPSVYHAIIGLSRPSRD